MNEGTKVENRKPTDKRSRFRFHYSNNPAFWHYVILAVLLLAVFAFQLWITSQKRYVQIGGADFPNVMALGRQLAEFHTLPVFRYPGKTYGGAVKSLVAFFPCVIFGYHEWIPWLMMMLVATLIPFVCYLIARVMISRSAGLIALILAGASDPKIAGYVMKPAYGLDVIILLGLTLGLCSVSWSRKYHEKRRQPGVVFCLFMGLVAGFVGYAHPIGAVPIAASALFLLLSLGMNVFTWRVPVVALGTFLGSIRFWMFYAQNPVLLSSWGNYSGRYERTSGLRDVFFSKDGYVWYILSPSGSSLARCFLGLSVLIVGTVLVYKAIRFFPRAGRRVWKEGFSLPPSAYAVCFLLVSCVLVFKTAGMSQASAGWSYGVELWFWFVIAGASVLDWIMRRKRIPGALVFIFLSLTFLLATVRTFPDPPAKYAERYRNIKADAEAMVAMGYTNILSAHYRNYMYFAFGPPGLYIGGRYKPWLRNVAQHVEETRAPALISALTPATLGTDTWESTSLRTVKIHHSFKMPAPGVILSNNSWNVLVDGEGDSDLLCDDNLATVWWDLNREDQLAFTIELDRPRPICRICMFVQWEDADSTYYTYPGNLKIEGQLPSGEWVVLTDGAEPDGYFWDGGRLFHAEKARKRFDIRFPVREISRIRLRDKDSPADWRDRKVTELYVFEDHDCGGNVDRDVEDILAYVQARGVKRVFADRFVSAQVGKRFPEIKVWQPMALRFLPFFTANPDDAWPWSPDLEPVMVEESSLIVADSAFSPRIEKILREEQMSFTSKQFGFWTAYEITGSDWGCEESPLVWNGMSLGRYSRKSAALARFNKGRQLLAEHREREAVDLLRSALAIYPRYYEAGNLLEQIVGPRNIVCTDWRESAPPEKAFASPVIFANGAELLGVKIEPKNVRRGETLEMRYYWRLPHHWKYIFHRPWVFVHLGHSDYMIGDDHRVLLNYGNHYLREVIFPETFVEVRTVLIPKDAPTDKYNFDMGMHLSGKRVAVKTKCPDIPIDGKSVRLSGILVE